MNTREIIDNIKRYKDMSRTERGLFLSDLEAKLNSCSDGLAPSKNSIDIEHDKDNIELLKELRKLKKSLKDRDKTIVELERMLMLISPPKGS